MAKKTKKQESNVAVADEQPKLEPKKDEQLETTLAAPAPQNQQEALSQIPPTQQETGLATATASPVDDIFGGSGYQIPIDAPLPQIKILRETPVFETPEGEMAKEITGYIIYWHHANQFYERKFGEGEEGPPTCASPDGIKPDCSGEGMTRQCECCRDCEKNKYGSAEEGRGKACQNTIRLYFLVESSVIPCVLKASPASLSNKESLMRWLTNAPNIVSKATDGKTTKYQIAKVKFTLHTKEFADSGFSASVLDLETIAVLDPDDKEQMGTIARLGKLYQTFMTEYLGRITKDVSSEPSQQQTEEEGTTQEEEAPLDECPI